MNSMLQRVVNMSKRADENEVQSIIRSLGETPSIKTLEEVLKYYKGELKKILSKDLLEWMQENDQVTFETEDLKVSIKTYVSAKIHDAEAGFRWLEDHDYGDLIKDTLNFPKGEFTEEAEKALHGMGLSYEQKRGVHPQSLTKVIRECLDMEKDLPIEGDDDDPGDGIKVNYYDECIVRGK